MRLKPLTVSDIRIGEPLPWAVYDKAGHLLLKQGVIVAGENQLRGLVERGFQCDQSDGGREHRHSNADLLEREPDSAFGRIRGLAVALRGIHHSMLSEHPHEVGPRVAALALSMQAALNADTDAALAAMQIDAADNGFIERHLHAAALCELIGRALERSPSQRLSLDCAALTFDIGFAALYGTLDRQAAPLDAEQREQLHSHPGQSLNLLQAAGVGDPLWLAAVADHHERIDGSGYPRHLCGEAIGTGARLLAICDIYSAMIRPRAYRGALPPRIALRDIFLERGKLVDEALAAVFVKELGIYPPGTFVRLHNGEIAVVTRRQRNAAHPALRCVVNRDGSPAARAAPRDCQSTDGAIVEVVSSQNFRCVLGNIHQLWEGREELRPATAV